MGKIKQLPIEVVNMIAAGEVVERPASVVKELLENSIDANAKTIIVKLLNGGIDLIEITDDGEGMDQEDAIMAFTQHATSKLRTANDLEKILTLGFRGEALASISAVSDIDLETKRNDTDAVHVKIVRQKIETGPSAKAQSGTKLSIKKLFKHVPARRKFLRTAQTELNHVTSTFIATSLMHLNVRFELYHGPKLIHRLPAVEKLGQRVYDIWPKLEPRYFYNLEPEKEAGTTRLELYIGKPDIALKTRKQQMIFINSRPVSDRLLQKAVSDAYAGFIHRDLQPIYFIKLDLPPELVDVNVHPRKQEVKFANPGQVYSLVQRNIRALLTNQTKEEIVSRTQTATTTTENIYDEKKVTARPSFLADSGPVVKTYSPANKQKSLVSKPTKSTSKSQKIQASIDFSRLLLDKQTTRTSNQQESFFNFKPLQVFNTYIVYEQGEELVFVDQHAAAEKILYEKLMTQMKDADSAKQQPLLVPELLDFTALQKEAALKNAKQFLSMGLEINDFGGNSIQITAKPAATPNLNSEEFILANIQDSEEFDSNAELLGQIANPDLHNLIASAACHGSVRAGQRLSEPEMRQIVLDLRDCNYPYNCPHGRPVSWTMQKYELEKEFKRVI